MDLEELYSAAQREGVLNLYAAGSYAEHRAAVDRFKAKFPGIRVNLSTGHSSALAATIDAQRAGGRLEADVAMLESVWDFDRWATEGALTSCTPDGFGGVMPAFKDTYGAYVAVRLHGLGYAHNAELVDACEMPRSAIDFFDPKFRGRFASVLPQRDPVVLYLYHTIIDKYGWRFADRVLQNQIVFANTQSSLLRKLSEGTVAVALGAVSGGGSSANIRFHVPVEDPMPVWALTAAVFTGAPNPHASQLFLTWSLSVEEQWRVAEGGAWSARADVAPPESLLPLTSYRVANRFREFMKDNLRLTEMRRRFERYPAFR